MNSATVNAITTYLEDHRAELLGLYEALIRQHSYSKDVDDVLAAIALYQKELEKEGAVCTLVDVGANAPTMVACIGAERPGAPVVLAGHIDTIFLRGLWQEPLFRIEDGVAYGPGVYDMKGGLIIILGIIKALNHIGYNERPIKLVVSGDEEINHTNSTSASVFEREAQGAVCAFNFEPTDSPPWICIGRKGNVRFGVQVHGFSAHCMNADKPGVVSAIREMAYKIIDWHAITNWNVGTSVNVGVITGGTAPNTVPDLCEVEIDIRFATYAEMDKAIKKFETICNTAYLEGTRTEYKRLNIMDVYERSPKNDALFDFVAAVSEKYGFGPRETNYRSGGSDAAYLSRAGVPTLCSCGVVGGSGHTIREFASVESIFNRAGMLAAVIVDLDEFRG